MGISGKLDDFVFTQQSLLTFENCPLKFKRRYIDKLRWSNAPGERSRRSLEMGIDFHLLARRYFMSIPTGLENKDSNCGEMCIWLESLKNNFKIDARIRYIPEYKLRTSLSGYRLEANFDLLMIKDDSIQIWDWKTHQQAEAAKKALNGIKLKSSLQTIVYLFVLKEQLPYILSRGVECIGISMHYWQPHPPGILSEIVYNCELHEEYREMLKSRINRIISYDYSDFNKELYVKHCKYCEFNWLCNNKSIDIDDIAGECED